MMDIFSVQLTILLALLIGNFLSGILPIFCIKIIERFSGDYQNTSKGNKAITFLLYFGGGVFISICFINLLPRAHGDFEIFFAQRGNPNPEVSKAHAHQEGFPVPEFTVLCGFFATFVLQELLSFILLQFRKATSGSKDTRVRFCSCAKRHTECSRTFKDVKPDQTLFGLEKKKLLESGNASGSGQPGPNRVGEDRISPKGDLLRSAILVQQVPNYGALTNAPGPGIEGPGPVLTPSLLIADDEGVVVKQQAVQLIHSKYPVNSFLTITALSLQAIFQGIEIGLLATTKETWPIYLVLCLQQFLITFVAGIEILAGSEKILFVTLGVSTLSIMSPIGVTLSMLTIDSVEKISHLVKGIISGVTCGALLYITFYEILRQKRSEVSGFLKFFSIALGTSCMVILQYASSVF